MALTGKNEIVGTLYYMSPEQLQAQATGQEIDAAATSSRLDLVLYEMLTGKRAFEGSSPASVIAAIMERPAPSHRRCRASRAGSAAATLSEERSGRPLANGARFESRAGMDRERASGTGSHRTRYKRKPLALGGRCTASGGVNRYLMDRLPRYATSPKRSRWCVWMWILDRMCRWAQRAASLRFCRLMARGWSMYRKEGYSPANWTSPKLRN